MNTDETPIEAYFIEEAHLEDSSEEGGLLSLNQVAEALGVSNPTARRLCMSGRLAAVKVLISEQLCWKVKPESLKAYQEALFTEAASEESSKATRQKARQKGSSEQDRIFTNGSSGDFPLEAHLTALETARMALDRLERVERQLEEQRDRMEHQRARADLAERQKFALEFELRQYQAALAEHSESLAELRAEKLAVETRLEELVKPTVSELSSLKMDIQRPRTFGQRVRGWFGFKQAQ